MKPESSDLLKPGQTVGGCTIKARIAKGGMGTVYLARKDLLNKTVALKILHPEFTEQKDHCLRFLREAKVAASLDHSGTVKVYDVGEEDGFYYMVMEYVEGKDLKTLVDDCGPLSSRKVLKIGRQIAEALSYAHKKGLIHRDIKPANILLTESGDAKLADFGLARLSAEDHEVTTTGQILGTPVYMSPEQCRGDSLDGRSDLYSLGATLYFILTGQVPFRGENTATLIHNVINKIPVSVKALAPDVSDKVVGIVQRLMGKHQSSRFQNGKELVAAIDDVLVGRFVFANETRAVEVESPVFGDFPWGRLAFLLVLGLLLGVGVYFLGSQAEGLTSQENVLEGSGKAEGAEEVVDVKFGGAPGGSRSQPRFVGQAFSDDHFRELRDRVSQLLQDISVGDDDAVFSYLKEADGRDWYLEKAAKRVLHEVSAFKPDSAAHHTNQRIKGEAKSSLTFEKKGSREPIKVVVKWKRFGGVWYVCSVAAPETTTPN